MSRYNTCTLEELDLYVYMARERLAVAESLQNSIGMTDSVVSLHKDLQKLLSGLRWDLQKAQQAVMERGEA